ncbi:MAG: methionine biosynthesis protein MetW [bacterium]|nr:methionine biosynthesis protein MetW [bacterium]
MNQYIHDQVIQRIPDGSRVLDLGTGDGALLERLLRSKKESHGEGVEKDPEMVARCIERGLVVHQGDILDGLDQYGPNSFDYVLLIGTFQELLSPERVLRESFRVGRRVIVAYMNLAYWRYRFQLTWGGVSPRLEATPLPWYESPNIQFFSVVDFREFCQAKSILIQDSAFFNSFGRVRFMPNFRSREVLSVLELDGEQTAERDEP